MHPVETLKTARSVPLVYAPYQHIPLKHWPQTHQIPCEKTLFNVKTVPGKLSVYPGGFKMTQDSPVESERPEHLNDTLRGDITGFSNKSATRLREFMMTHHRENAYPFAVTLTTQGQYSPEQWESIIKRFRTRLSRCHPDWAVTWRVELQKRRTPHLHCVFWMDQPAPPEAYKALLTGLWLKATHESGKAVLSHSVFVRDLTGESQWMIYCTLHDTKSKKSQLGWKGRQWGIWNKKAFHRREPLTEGEFSQHQRILFCRRLRAWSQCRYKGRRVKALRIYHNKNLPAFAMDFRSTGQLLRGIVASNIPPDSGGFNQFSSS